MTTYKLGFGNGDGPLLCVYGFSYYTMFYRPGNYILVFTVGTVNSFLNNILISFYDYTTCKNPFKIIMGISHN